MACFSTGLYFVGLLGLEPKLSESKSEVLPLHHKPVLFHCKNSVFYLTKKQWG